MDPESGSGGRKAAESGETYPRSILLGPWEFARTSPNAYAVDEERGGDHVREKISEGLAAAVVLGSFGGSAGRGVVRIDWEPCGTKSARTLLSKTVRSKKRVEVKKKIRVIKESVDANAVWSPNFALRAKGDGRPSREGHRL
jgi:hypothetical protein